MVGWMDGWENERNKNEEVKGPSGHVVTASPSLISSAQSSAPLCLSNMR